MTPTPTQILNTLEGMLGDVAQLELIPGIADDAARALQLAYGNLADVKRKVAMSQFFKKGI